MKRVTAHIKGVFFITRQANHYMVHFVLGIVWFFLLKRAVPELGLYHFGLSIFGSILPDLEHLLYFFTHGKRDQYSLKVRSLIREKQWTELTLFLKHNHKHLTALKFHCLQWTVFLAVITVASYVYDHFSTVVLLGAMVIHYGFDIIDDFIFLGKLNPNWKKGIIRRPKFS